MKLIIMTTCITRGSFHEKSLGIFYQRLNYHKFIETNQIHHILNIDHPIDLKKHFTVQETVKILNDLLPKHPNFSTSYILNENPSFLRAYTNIMQKIIDLNLLSDDNIYWWLEDDWVLKSELNLPLDLLLIPNSAMNFTESSPLGSFRAGPIMSGSYFKNYFNLLIHFLPDTGAPVLNTTCDPEKQVNRWLSGMCRNNGNQMIQRNISNNKVVHIIGIYTCKKDVNIKHYNTSWYQNISKFSTDLIFRYYALICTDIYQSITYEIAEIKKSMTVINYNKISIEQFNDYFNNKLIVNDQMLSDDNDLAIKYFFSYPFQFQDIGREFNMLYDLEKWQRIEDDTSYKITQTIPANYGIWKVLSYDQIRFNPRITVNKGFFSSFLHILQILPYLEYKYFSKGIKLDISFYSHIYGNYPNFDVLNGGLITINTQNISYDKTLSYTSCDLFKTDISDLSELNELYGIFLKICGHQFDLYSKQNDTINYYSFKKNFHLANQYLYRYFKFNESFLHQVKQYKDLFKGKKVLGLHYRGTDMNTVKWVNHISAEEFLEIIKYHLYIETFNIIYLCTDDSHGYEVFKQGLDCNKYEIIYSKSCEHLSTTAKHIERYNNIKNTIKNFKNDLYILEQKLKEECHINQEELKQVLIDSFVLSNCNTVIKTHSQVSAFSKILNPDLEIYRVNGSKTGFWADAYIPLYKEIHQIRKTNISYETQETYIFPDHIQQLLNKLSKNELSESSKLLYKDFVM